jgi:hypothetical protein
MVRLHSGGAYQRSIAASIARTMMAFNPRHRPSGATHAPEEPDGTPLVWPDGANTRPGWPNGMRGAKEGQGATPPSRVGPVGSSALFVNAGTNAPDSAHDVSDGGRERSGLLSAPTLVGIVDQNAFTYGGR